MYLYILFFSKIYFYFSKRGCKTYKY